MGIFTAIIPADDVVGAFLKDDYGGLVGIPGGESVGGPNSCALCLQAPFHSCGDMLPAQSVAKPLYFPLYVFCHFSVSRYLTNSSALPQRRNLGFQ